MSSSHQSSFPFYPRGTTNQPGGVTPVAPVTSVEIPMEIDSDYSRKFSVFLVFSHLNK